MKYKFVLGAKDPEMKTIETILSNMNMNYSYLTENVTPQNAYKEGTVVDKDQNEFLVAIECKVKNCDFLIDHHNPGDYGYGKSPNQFWKASSIGQLWNFLIKHDFIYSNEEIHSDFIIVAAADHCLSAAYQGLCPGVSPQDVFNFRISSRSKYQNIDSTLLLSRIKDAQNEIKNSPYFPLDFGVSVKDMRRIQPIPELVEASMLENVEYISGPLINNNQVKFTCSGKPNTVNAFLKWANSNFLICSYGDPNRGFAGAYLCPFEVIERFLKESDYFNFTKSSYEFPYSFQIKDIKAIKDIDDYLSSIKVILKSLELDQKMIINSLENIYTS